MANGLVEFAVEKFLEVINPLAVPHLHIPGIAIGGSMAKQ